MRGKKHFKLAAIQQRTVRGIFPKKKFSQVRIRLPTLALKPRRYITKSPKQGYQWPQKWACFQQILKKRKEIQRILINHWLINWGQFKELLCNLCHIGSVITSWSPTQEVVCLTRMHSSRMHITRSSRSQPGGGLPQCMLGYTPLGCWPGNLQGMLGYTTPLETCKAYWDTTYKACWDTTPLETCKACWDTAPLWTDRHM